MIKIMEYMCFRKADRPIPYHRERIFSAGDAAISFKDNDVVQFAEAILALLDDPDRRERMGEHRAGADREAIELADPEEEPGGGL